jgi:uncharacterized protein YkwD
MKATVWERRSVLARLGKLLAIGSAWLLLATPLRAAQRANCQFVSGFKALHELDPADVGDCLGDQAYAANGDAQQRTTRGLLVWRKADNFTAFTDGFRTWVNGPYGLQKRLNSERFAWESSTYAFSGLAADLFAQLNAQRQSNGLPPVAANPLLAGLAEVRSQQIVDAGGALSHYDANGNLIVQGMLGSSASAFPAVAENLAESGGSPDQSVNQAGQLLMGSPPHRANILNPTYTQAGVAVGSRAPNGPFIFVEVLAGAGSRS